MVSLLTASVIWLQQVSSGGRIRRVLSVPKMRSRRTTSPCASTRSRRRWACGCWGRWRAGGRGGCAGRGASERQEGLQQRRAYPVDSHLAGVASLSPTHVGRSTWVSPWGCVVRPAAGS